MSKRQIHEAAMNAMTAKAEAEGWSIARFSTEFFALRDDSSFGCSTVPMSDLTLPGFIKIHDDETVEEAIAAYRSKLA